MVKAHKSIPLLILDALLIFISVCVTIYGFFITFVGVPGKRIVEVTEATLEKSQEIWHFTPAPQGFIIVFSSVLLIIGLLGSREGVSWLGIGILFVFSVVFLFGIGGGILPIATLLLVLLLSKEILTQGRN